MSDDDGDQGVVILACRGDSIEMVRARARAQIERMRAAAERGDSQIHRTLLEQLGALGRPYRGVRLHVRALRGDPVARGQLAAELGERARRLGQRWGRRGEGDEGDEGDE